MFVQAKNSYLIQQHIYSIYRANLGYDYVSISMGAFDWKIILYWLCGKKCARLWLGTDVWKALKYWDYRIRCKLCALFSDNLCVAWWLKKELCEIGIKSMVIETYVHDIVLQTLRNHKAS